MGADAGRRITASSAATPPNLVQASTWLFLALLGNNACNYIFHSLASRALGPGDYGALVSLLALLGLLTIPSQTIQTAVAQHVAVTQACGRYEDVPRLMQRVLWHMLVAGAILALALAAASSWLKNFFHLTSGLSVLAAGLTGIAMLCVSVARGWLQGLQRFRALGLNVLSDGLFRLGAGCLIFAAGWRVAGGIGASGLATTAAFLLALFFLPSLQAPAGTNAPRISARPLYTTALPVGIYLTAFMALASVDVFLVKHFFSASQAGYYGAASMVGKAYLFVGISLAQVLFPKASAAHAQEEKSHHLLGKTLGLTALVLAGGAALAWPLAPLVIRTLFGTAFENSDTLFLVRVFGLAVSPLALAYVFLQYHLAIQHVRLVWLLCGDAALLTGVLWFFHPTPACVLGVAGINHLLLLLVLWGMTPRR